MTTTKKTTTKRNFSVKANKLPANPFQHEILELVDKQRSKAKRVEILKEYGNDALKALFIWNFDDSVISLLPDGHVPYKENEVPVGTDHTSLRREYKQLFHFVKGGNDGLSSLRRERLCLFRCWKDCIHRRQKFFVWSRIKTLDLSIRLQKKW